MIIMNIFRNSLATLLLITFFSNAAYNDDTSGFRKNKPSSVRFHQTLDEHERLHLIFMREEEKLARDVYTKLSMLYPNSNVFGKIAASESRHTCKVCDTLKRFSIEDPVVNDNVGVFSSEEFGKYFTNKYQELTDIGATSELDALYVGALIEEFDMIDIKTCPEVMIERIDSVKNSNDCGLVYTNNRVINSLYENLIDGSENHLRAFVSKIENYIGEGAYQAQVAPQEDVDTILGR